MQTAARSYFITQQPPKVLVTLLPDEEADFWLQASQTSLDTVWDNSEDSDIRLI